MNQQPSTSRRSGRPPADEAVSAEAVLDAALAAFATYGYDGVSVRTLNRELGVSHNLINQRFGSKAGLWRAAVDHGFGGLVRHMEGVFDPTLSDPLDQLALVISAFLRFSAAHPQLLGLMDIEGRLDTDRLTYIYDEYIAPSLAGVDRLLDHLIATGRIRPITLRSLHFLIAHGAAAPFTLVPLAEHFDHSSPLSTRDVEHHAKLISEIVVTGLRIPEDAGVKGLVGSPH
jgi:AcrR family transcriptional regulator